MSLHAAYEQVRQVLASSGPSGTPSPYVREQDRGFVSGRARPAREVRGRRARRTVPAGAARRRLTCHPHCGVGGRVRAIRPAPLPTVVQQLEHVARWEQLRELGSHRSALADAVQLRIYPAGPDEMALPSDRDPYALAGEYTIPYGSNGDAPNVFMHLKNTSDRDLHVALLDLTDRLECDVLYPDADDRGGHGGQRQRDGRADEAVAVEWGRSGSGRTHAGLAEDRRERAVRSTAERLRARRRRRAVEIDRDVRRAICSS